MKSILVLAETGFIIRNLLLGFFAKEVLKGARLIVAVRQPNDPNLAMLFQNENIQFIEFPFENYRDSRSFLRKALSWDNLLYSIELSRKSNKSLEIQTRLFEGYETLIKVFVRKASLLIARLIRALGLSDWLRTKYLESYIGKKAVCRLWLEILEKNKPDVVLTTMLTHSLRYRPSSDLPVAVAARSLGIPVCTLVQSWDNLSSKTSVLPNWLAHYFTWSDFMSRELLMYNPHITKNQVTVVGSPQYDFHGDASLLIPRERYLPSLGLNPAKKYVLIGTGTEKWMPDEPEKVIALISQIQNLIPELQVLVRLHPKDNGSRWDKHMGELKARGVSIQFSSPETPMDLGGFVPPRDFYEQQINAVYHSCCVINSSSSLTVDAAILDRPVICIGYDLHNDRVFPEGRAFSFSQSNHFQSLVATGGVAVVRSAAACVAQIEAYLNEPSRDQQGRREIVRRVKGEGDKLAGVVLAREILATVHSD